MYCRPVKVSSTNGYRIKIIIDQPSVSGYRLQFTYYIIRNLHCTMKGIFPFTQGILDGKMFCAVLQLLLEFQHWCFPVKFMKFLKTPFLHSNWYSQKFH